MVDVYLSTGTLSADQLRRIELAIPYLRRIVASTLSHPETGEFPEDEVTNETHYMKTARPGEGASAGPRVDFMECDVQVFIRSNRYPWRMAIKDELAEKIMDAWDPMLPGGITAWAWLDLLEAGFAKRKPRVVPG